MELTKIGYLHKSARASLFNTSIAFFGSLLLTGAFSAVPASAADPTDKRFATLKQSAPDAGAQAATAAPAAPVVSPALQQALAAYSSNPDQASFDRMVNVMKDALCQPPLRDVDASVVIKNHPQLAELAARAIDAGGAKVWAFNKCPFAQTCIILTGHPAVPAAPGKPPVPAFYRAQLLSMPQNISIWSAKIVTKTNPAPAKMVKVGKGRNVKLVKQVAPAAAASPGAPAAAKYLVITGNDRSTGLITLYGLKPTDAGWAAAPELFTSVPPFLLSSVQGKASFSGSDIVLAIASNKPQAEKPAAAGKAAGPASGSYKIVLKFLNSKYLLEGKAPDEGPAMVVHQFLQAVKVGRQDVAKAWLADDHLAAIPKYLGLYGKTDQVYKLVAMSNPMGGGSRFRVVTFGKDDLILDVGPIKKNIYGKPTSYVAIKALFVAPPDPFAKKLVGVTPNFERIGDTAPSSEASSNKTEQKQ